jgi:hypothetical protein
MFFYFICLKNVTNIVVKIFPTQKSGGLDSSTAAKILIFQKAMSGCGLSADDVVRALLMQSALAADGVSSKNILAAVADIVRFTIKCRSNDTLKFLTPIT